MNRITAFLCLASILAVGCGSGQTANCKKYVDCYNAVSPGTANALDSTYGASGTCWQTHETSTACDSVCAFGLTSLRSQNPSVAACQ